MSNLNSFKRPSQDPIFIRRMTFFAAFIICVVGVITLRTGYIQIIRYFDYSLQSRSRSEMSTIIPPVRGKIVSSDGVILADNIKTFDFYINPSGLNNDLTQLQEELVYLSNVIGIDYNTLSKLIRDKRREREILIKENIPFSTMVAIKENEDNLSGIIIKENMLRIYPRNDIASHVIGYTGVINLTELQLLDGKGYSRNDTLGKTGLELQYEDILRGSQGRRVHYVDAKRNIREEKKSDYIPPRSGNNITLTINERFQRVVEEILADRNGVIVVSKPATGEILAMASYPDYNPNDFIINTPETTARRRSIALDTFGTPLINRAIQATYPAASIHKTIASLIVLSEQIIPEEKTFFCNGTYKLGTQVFGCWSVHGSENLEQGYMNSCDVYYYNVGLLVGIERLHRYADLFGYGKPTGIDLASEKLGNNPSRQWFRTQGNDWYDGNTLNTVIGQGDVKITPLQLLNMVSVIANKGHSYRPHLLKSYTNPDTGEVVVAQPEILTTVDLEERVYNRMIQLMRLVVTRGTGINAFRNNNYQFVGKTGTGEVGFGDNKQTHSLFAGFGPIDYPIEDQIAVIVVVEYENGQVFKWAPALGSQALFAWVTEAESFKDVAQALHYPYRTNYCE